MKVIAKTMPGSEYLYSPRTAHAVSARSADVILGILNKYRFRLKENETWHVYDVDQYDLASDYAAEQRFTIQKGIVTERYSAQVL